MTGNVKLDSLIMGEVLKAMQVLGVQVTRKEVKREIRDHSEAISEEKVDEVSYIFKYSHRLIGGEKMRNIKDLPAWERLLKKLYGNN